MPTNLSHVRLVSVGRNIQEPHPTVGYCRFLLWRTQCYQYFFLLKAIDTCFVNCQEFFLFNVYLSGPFNFLCSKPSLPFFFALRMANTGSRVGPGNKIGHHARRHKRLLQVSVLSASVTKIGCCTCYGVSDQRYETYTCDWVNCVLWTESVQIINIEREYLCRRYTTVSCKWVKCEYLDAHCGLC